jgi:hypothetical protein
MKNNLFLLDSKKEKILTAEEFRNQLEIQKKAYEHSESEKQKKEFILQEKEWNCMVIGIANCILEKMLKRRNEEIYVNAKGLLGRYGIRRKKGPYIREYNGWIGFLEEALREQKKIDELLDNDGTLRGHFQRTHGTPLFNEFHLPIPEIRFYGVSDSAIKEANRNKNTYVFVIMEELERLLKENGYKVENTLELVRQKNTKFTAAYSGGLKISVK